ncbi:MAG: hypothetical protein AAGG48_14020 [Planctomycetota bacterium]
MSDSNREQLSDMSADTTNPTGTSNHVASGHHKRITPKVSEGQRRKRRSSPWMKLLYGALYLVACAIGYWVITHID